MNEVLRIGKAAFEMHITVQGYKVTLCFADKANPEVAAFVKQALLGAYPLCFHRPAAEKVALLNLVHFPPSPRRPDRSGVTVRQSSTMM